MKALKGLSLAAVAALAAVLVPLYGDPRRAPVTHTEWAHMLLRALEMEAVLTPGTTAPLAFDSLAWRTSLSLKPEKPFRHSGVEFLPGPPAAARAIAAGAELAYRVAIARHGDFRVRAKLGLADRADSSPVVVELTRNGETSPDHSKSSVPAVLIDSGALSLRPGLYTLSIGLPLETVLEAIEIVPPCLNSIEPKGGWRATSIATTVDVAVTTLKAIDDESELPPAATPIEVPSTAFLTVTTQLLKATLGPGREGFWLNADASGLEAVAHVEIPQAGLHTVYAFGLAGGGHTWIADGCLKTVVCPTASTPEVARWIPVMTAEFSAGRHTLAMALANGAGVQRLKIERKKDGAADYLATLARLGLDLGGEGPVPRRSAADAMDFIRKKRTALELNRCGEVPPPSPNVIVAGLAIPPGVVSVGSNAPVPGPGAVPFIPRPASPGPVPSPGPTSTPAPVVSPSPAPSPSPSPSLGPPPTTVAQPPASPVKE